MINTLIETSDNMELVRDKIKEILDKELANQRQLATDAGKDTAPWDIRVFIERTAPWEEFLSPDTPQFDDRPIVNISFEDSSQTMNSSSPILQQFTSTFNLDVMTTSKAKATAEGHDPGDYSAGIRAHETVRIIRNILSVVEYETLELPGKVTERNFVGVTRQEFQDPQVQSAIYAIRIRLGVNYNEDVIEYVGEAMEQLNVDATYKQENVNSTYNYT